MMSAHITENTVIVQGFMEKLVFNIPLREHVQHCQKCRETLYTYALYLQNRKIGFPALTEIEKKRIRETIGQIRATPKNGNYNFLWQRMNRILAIEPEALAAADGQNADQQLQQASMQNGYLHFTAKCDKNDPHYWCAQIAIPVQSNLETVLRIRLNDGDGNRIPDGRFHLCGFALPVKNGMALLLLREFRKHLNVPIVCMEYSDGQRQDGVPILFGPGKE